MAMTEQERIIKDISLCRFKDPRVIKTIVNHPILFTKRVMSNPDDYRSVRIRYFGVFTQKYAINKEVLKMFVDMQEYFKSPEYTPGDFGFKDSDDAILYMHTLLKNSKKDDMYKLYDMVNKAIADNKSFD